MTNQEIDDLLEAVAAKNEKELSSKRVKQNMMATMLVLLSEIAKRLPEPK